MKHTPVPMEHYQQGVYEIGRPNKVWIIRVPLRAVHKRPKSVQFNLKINLKSQLI